jgi:hypothetical protein
MPKFRYVPSTRIVHVAWALVALILVGLLFLLLATVTRQAAQLDRAEVNDAESREDRAELHDAVGELSAALDEANERLVIAGRTPVGEPAEVEAVVGDRGPRGFPGEPGRDGKDGRDGLDGRDGTGRDGSDGRDGAAGATGSDGQDGARGPSCVEELGIDACRGPKGDPGADSTVPGPQGERGPQGAPGTAQPGTYACPEGEYVVGFTIGDGGGVTLFCRPFPHPPGQQP